MPTRDQKEAVCAQIERLEHSSFSWDGETLTPNARGPAALGFAWTELTEQHKIEVLAISVDWRCFDAEQEWDVVQNVLDGKDRYHWMDGIATDRESEPTALLDMAMEAIGNNQLPASIRAMEDEYHRSLSSRPTPAVEAKSDFDRMMEEVASNAKYVTRGEEIDR